MFPRSILRTKSFWLGIFILSFIGWVWVRAFNTLDVMNLKTLQSRFLITNSVNGLSIIREHDPLGKWNTFDYDISPMPLPATAPRPLFPDPGTLDLFESQGIGSGAFRAAHWFLILLFLIPWTIFFLWRRHRIRNLPSSAHQHFATALGLRATCELVRHGWRPWRNEPRAEASFVETFGPQWQPVIGPFLRSLGGFDHGYLTVWECPYRNQQMIDLELKISGIVGSRLVPVASGNYHGENNILWIDEDGRGYLSDNGGLIFLGHNIAQSIETLIFGKKKRPTPPPELKDALAAAYEWEDRP